MQLAAAMVLAAGRGMRMRPLTELLPKPALPLPDGPLVARTLRVAARVCPGRVVINTWHLARRMERAARSVDLGSTELAISREPQLMDTAGGLALARKRGLLGDRGPILVLNGDCLLGLDLEPLLETHVRKEDLVTLALLPHLDPIAWSRIHLDRDGTVRAILPPGEPAEDEVPFLYPGAMVVSRAALDALPVRPADIWSELWRPALDQRRLRGVVVGGHWREVGTPEAYLSTVLKILGGVSQCDPGARVHRSAAIEASMIGAGVRVAAAAEVVESVVAAGARVATGARVVRSVLLGPVTVAAGETLEGAVCVAAGRS